jgi:hypothetical protein
MFVVSNYLMVRRLTIAVALGTLIAFGSLFFYGHLVNKRAQVMVRSAYELSEKQTPTVSDLQERFGHQLRLQECRASDCAYGVQVSNRILAALHLAPYTEMESQFWVRDGLVVMNAMTYSTTVNRRNNVVTHVQIDLCDDCQTFAIHPWDAASPLDTNGIVEVGSQVSSLRRRSALSLNTGCLVKLNGCQSVADLLPTVWKQTADRKIACVIQNDRGFVQKPANWP